MIRSGPVVPAKAGLAGADALCPTAWNRVSAALSDRPLMRGQAGQDADWCVVDGLVLDLDWQCLPDCHMDRRSGPTAMRSGPDR